MIDVNSRLNLIVADYWLRMVRVVVTEPLEEGIPTPAGMVRARRGDELEIPRWQAKLLAEKGVVTLKDKDIDIDTINMYHYKEKKRSAANQITSLPHDFYLKVAELVEKLDALIRERPSHIFIRDREILEKNLAELAEARLAKIIRLATTGEGGLRDRLTPEETIVYDILHDVISSWREYVKRPFTSSESSKR